MIVNFLFLFVFCSLLLKGTLTLSDNEIEHAYDDCLKEFNIAVDEIDSSEIDVICFHTCVAKKIGIIENGKINEKELFEYYFQSSVDSQETKEIIESCIKEIPFIQDDCELFNELRNCILNE
ncbi:uncharacterized protein LOC122503821 [Leptopilina heterotoma]|uniref:uncharacterized protein LOC122503821 n=1 Tax=Leptopilina heterotoma TaxID=63436 RepID=UPI001CA8EF6F|nr:uncharacterized protein LOC122503821 [Leptopilina heterotoma]